MNIEKTQGLVKAVFWPVSSGLMLFIIISLYKIIFSNSQIDFIDQFIIVMTDDLWLGFVVALVVFISRTWLWLESMKVDLVTAHFGGMYRLISDLTHANALKNLETIITTVTGNKTKFRGVILDYVLHSMESHVGNGFPVVDSCVDAYIKFITELALKGNWIASTCVVRPDWFVVDEIQGVTLAPFVDESNEYGKGEPLRCFKKSLIRRNSERQRCLIVDEQMIAEVFLSANIDIKGVSLSGTDCPYCFGSLLNPECPFHGNNARKKISESSITDIPEIQWFSKEVNNGRGVKLIYTVVKEEMKSSIPDLDDRVYATTNDGFRVELRFSFTSHEQGILRLFWDDAVLPLVKITKFNERIDPKTGKSDIFKGHKFYTCFSECLKREDLKDSVILHLQCYQEQIKKYFTKSNINRMPGANTAIVKNYLCNGSTGMKNHLLESTENLIQEIKLHSLCSLYIGFISKYKEIRSFPNVAYIVTYDSVTPEYPVRIARRKENWKGICHAKG